MTRNSNENQPDEGELNDADLPDDILALLSDEATWEPVSAEMEDAIVAAVLAEIDTSAALPPVTAAVTPDSVAADSVAADSVAPAAVTPDSVAPDTVVPMPSRWKTAALGAAAALIVVAGLFGLTQLGGESPDLELALAGTDLAPLASAEAEITETPEGTRIVISVTDLPPAPPGTYYQAWLRIDAEIGVSAGTFHLRDGDGPIELWAGVSTDDYPLLTVTLQQEAQTESSGQVVLKALVGDN